MADQIDDFLSSSSDFSLGSESEVEEETIWYMGQVQNSALTPYMFEPRRSQRDRAEDSPSESESDQDSDNEPPEETPEEPQILPEDDRTPVPEEWKTNPGHFCTCGHCSAETLKFKREAVCCFSNQLYLRPFWVNEERVCTSTVQEFKDCVLNPTVLLNQLIGLKNVRGDHLNVQSVPEHKYRWIAYTAFTWWIYQGKLGYRNRRVVPACCAHAIRLKYPQEDPDEEFVPFELAPDSD